MEVHFSKDKFKKGAIYSILKTLTIYFNACFILYLNKGHGGTIGCYGNKQTHTKAVSEIAPYTINYPSRNHSGRY